MPSRHADRSVLTRAFSILEAFDHTEPELSLAELAARTRLPKATLHRLAGQLVDESVLVRTAGGYEVGDRMFALGEFATRRLRLRGAAVFELRELAESSGHVLALAILDGCDAVCLDTVGPGRGAVSHPRVGGRTPAYRSGLGKALLAFSPRAVIDCALARGPMRRTAQTIAQLQHIHAELRLVRHRGVAFEVGEDRPDYSCIAAPILGQSGYAVAAISMEVQVPRFPDHASGLLLGAMQRIQRATARHPDRHWDRRAESGPSKGRSPITEVRPT